MSSVNVKVRADSVTVWSDGAMLQDDGKLYSLMSKVSPVPHLGGVLAVLGDPIALVLMVGFLLDARCRSFDDVKGCLTNGMRKVAAQPTHRPSQVIFAGWSEESGCPKACLVQSMETDGIKPFRLAPIGSLCAPRPLDASLEDLTDPIATMESQRLNISRKDGLPDAHSIGGFIQETVVTRQGISTRIIKRWDDEFGKKISPVSCGKDCR